MSFNRISVRIGIWYAATSLVGSFLLFLLIGFFLASSLKSKDRELLEAKFQDYSQIFERDGVSGLRTRSSSSEIPDAARFLVRLADKSGKTLFLHPPTVSPTETNAPTVDQIETFLSSQKGEGPWLTIKGMDYGDDIEILSRRLPSGELLQVGKDIEDREDFMKGYARAFFAALVPIFFLSIAIGLLLSNRLLAPIRWLLGTVKEIRGGKEGARVPVRGTTDELDVLARTFNQMIEEKERLVRAMKETLDHVAHDLRTPLMRLQSSAQHGIQSSTNIEACKESLADCQENSELILRMLNAILDISEAEAGTLHLTPEALTAATVIDDVVSLYDFVAEEKQIRLVKDSVCEKVFLADRGRLVQAVANLIDNAIKYSPRGSQVTLSACEADGKIEFRVSDQGPGLTEQELSKVWTRLYRGDQSRSVRGMGLGLSLVRAIAVAHSGDAHAVSNPQGGCSFQIAIPLKESSITKM